MPMDGNENAGLSALYLFYVGVVRREVWLGLNCYAQWDSRKKIFSRQFSCSSCILGDMLRYREVWNL